MGKISSSFLSAFFIFILFLFLTTQFAYAADLEIDKIDRGSVVISELDNPAVFDFVINNKGSADNFEIYSFVGVSMTPKGTFDLPLGNSTIKVEAYPSKEIRQRAGYFIFEYQIRGVNTGIFKDTLQIKIVNLKDAISISADPIKVGDVLANVTIKNAENTNLNDLKISFKSPFFASEKTVSLKPYEKLGIEVPIKEEARKLTAGNYLITADIQLQDATTSIEGTLKYLEKEGTSTETAVSGFIVRTKTITKTNEGNIPTTATIEIKKDIITRLFTVNSIEPTRVERAGLFASYLWEKELAPAESLVIASTTNYTFPFILLILVVIVVLLVKVYSQTALTLEKRVSFVKTKGGEFALKVTLHARARKHIDNVQLIDRLPAITKLYEKFGTRPDKIDGNTRRIFWNMQMLNAGEERIFTYIIYSKIKIVGRFELPAATGIYEYENKLHEVFSNRAFFAAETARGEE